MNEEQQEQKKPLRHTLRSDIYPRAAEQSPSCRPTLILPAFVHAADSTAEPCSENGFAKKPTSGNVLTFLRWQAASPLRTTLQKPPDLPNTLAAITHRHPPAPNAPTLRIQTDTSALRKSIPLH